MSDNFDYIRSLYQNSFRLHGDAPSALLTPKGRNDLRFRAVLPHIKRDGTTLLDYGCGLGYLHNFLCRFGVNASYTGMDMLPEFIDACRAKNLAATQFTQIDPHQPIAETYDVVFASGVFNLCTNSERNLSRAYAFERIEQLFAAANDVLVCDFLSSYVDFAQADAQHFSLGEIADFCASRLSRRFMIHHDLLPYEFTLVAWRRASIRRPENIFEVDLLTT